MSTSGTYNFAPSLTDLTIEAFGRCGIRPTSFTTQHTRDALMSANFLLSSWSVRVPNLWLVNLIQINLQQGVPTYNIPATTVSVLDAYVRQFYMAPPVNENVSLSTINGSTSVTINWPAHGQIPGNWIGIVIPLSVGGIIVYGFYTVQSVIDPNNLTISVASAATSTVNNGGVVPVFTTTGASQTVTVTFPNHGLLPTETFNVQVSTLASGLTIYGAYTVETVISSSQFTFTATGYAAGTVTVSENGGQAQYSYQQQGSQGYTDRITSSISRTDYASLPNKLEQGYPNSYWFNRQIQPNINMWLCPDQNGPYVLFLEVQSQFQDAVMTGGTGVQIPARFYDAFCADFASRLAQKYAPMLWQGLKLDAQAAWEEAAEQDTEASAGLFIQPMMADYFR